MLAYWKGNVESILRESKSIIFSFYVSVYVKDEYLDPHEEFFSVDGPRVVFVELFEQIYQPQSGLIGVTAQLGQWIS